MEYTNEILEKMNSKKQVNSVYAKYYFRMANEVKNVSSEYERLNNRSNSINDCLNLWAWDKYERNKVLDLRTVNRCKNNRFCPNCRKLDLAKSINHFQKPFKKLLDDGNYPYLLTLTVPNCKAEDLINTINYLNKCFLRLYRGFGETNQHTIGFRELEFTAALRVLEITYNFREKTYHPHFHCIVFSKYYNELYFSKNIKGKYSFKRQSYNFHSQADLHFMKIWTMINKKIRLTEKNYFNMKDDPKVNYKDGGLLLVDIREMDESGIYEVLKYTFKDTDISNYSVFKTMVQALYRRPIRSGYGLLNKIKFEDVEDGEKQSIEEYLETKEDPTNLLTREISELVTTYKEYRKVSRFTPNEYMNIID